MLPRILLYFRLRFSLQNRAACRLKELEYAILETRLSILQHEAALAAYISQANLLRKIAPGDTISPASVWANLEGPRSRRKKRV